MTEGQTDGWRRVNRAEAAAAFCSGMPVWDTVWQTKRYVDKKHTDIVHAGKMKGIETRGVGMRRKERKGQTEAQRMTRETGERKELELPSKTFWTKLIHLKAKCPNTKTLNYRKELKPNYTSPQVKTKLLVLQPLIELRSPQLLGTSLSCFHVVAVFPARRDGYI